MAYVNEESIHAGISFIHNFAEWSWTTLTFQEGAGYKTIHKSDVGWLHQINLWSTVIPMTFGKVSLASRVSARLSQPPVTETPAKDTCDRIDFKMLPQPLNMHMQTYMYTCMDREHSDFRHGKYTWLFLTNCCVYSETNPLDRSCEHLSSSSCHHAKLTPYL